MTPRQGSGRPDSRRTRGPDVAASTPQRRAVDSSAVRRTPTRSVEGPARVPALSATPVDSAPARTSLATRDTAPTPTNAPTQPVQQPVTSSSSVGQVSAPPVSARIDSAAPRVVAPPENPRAAVTTIVNAYAEAIATRSVAQVKRVYPAMTPAQQSAWESFFQSVRSMTADLEIDTFSSGADTAVAQITGAYVFVTRAGRSERQAASFVASFARDGDRWRLQTVR